MAIRHIGFAVIDKDGNPATVGEYDNLGFSEEKLEMEHYAKAMDGLCNGTAPHKVVRLLIDDGAE